MLNKKNFKEVNFKMKKLLSALLTISLISSTATIAYAEGNGTTTTSPTTQNGTLTPEQKQAKDSFLKVYYDYMNQLVALKNQIQEAQTANNNAAKQIKDKVKAKTTANSDTVSKLKDLAAQRKTLVEQAKQLHQQRITLKTQYKDAVKAKDVDKMKSIEQQILDLNNQISELKSKDDAIKAQIDPLKEQLKNIKDSNKELKDNTKNQLEQAKSIQETIKALEQEKTQLWTTYKENIKNKDYTAAEATLKSILDKKTSILANVKQRGTILNQVLSSLN